MEVSGDAEGGVAAATESQKVWRRLLEHLKNEDYEKAVQDCNTSELVLRTAQHLVVHCCAGGASDCGTKAGLLRSPTDYWV